MNNSTYYPLVKLLLAALPSVSEEKVFALKGGTAINLFLRNMSRLSVDIDLTYLPIQPREQSLNGIFARFVLMKMGITAESQSTQRVVEVLSRVF